MLTNLEVYSSQATAPDLPLVLGSREGDDPIHIRDIDGLGPVKANINTRALGTQDGEFYTGSSVGKRNIVIKVGFNPDWITHTPSSLRQRLYDYFMPKQEVQLRFFRDDGPTCEIFGFVEDCVPNIFSKDPEMQISVICPAPDFVGSAASVVTGKASNAPVEVAFTALSNVSLPIVLEVTAPVGSPAYDGPVALRLGSAVATDLRVFQVNATVAVGINYLLNSARGQKAAENLIVATGERVNLIPTMTAPSVWPVLKPGTNKVKVEIGSPVERDWKLTYFERFGGL